MIRKVSKAYTKDEVLNLMEPLVAEWFNSKFEGLTEPQSYAVPLIHDKKNVLVSSPTGSGKTLTAFLSIINELLKLQKKGKLEDKIYCVYISPLKALANDINKNLTKPLMEMKELAQKSGHKEPEIRTAIRHGDTSPSERQKMAQKPPHIFITTPETLSIVLSTPKFRFKFNDVKYVIVDEIHEVCSNKRGAHLSLTLERLQEHVKKEFVRIGLSATIAPIKEVAMFLVGYEKGKPRDIYVVEVEGTKRLDMKVLCPVADILALPSEIVNSKMYELLKDLIEESRTTLVFTNTRSGTEQVVYKLKERGLEDIEAHHGSLSKFIRLDVEDRLKNGELKAAISSTSLELGIDIGYIDLVCQVGSPKSIAKGLQRIGRAGHAYGDVSKGRLIVVDNDDLLECATLIRNAYDNRIDRVDIPTNCLDVLAQNIIGMSLEKKWDADEAYELVKRSHSFKTLNKKDFLRILEYLSSREPDQRIYSKIWFDEDENLFGRKRGSRMIYYTNVGTIPEEGSYTVISDRGIVVGELSEKFVEHLSSGDVFVLGGKPYQFERCRGMRVHAKRAEGRRPTVPSWAGEMLPRSFDLAVEVGKFRGLVLERLKEGKEATKKWLIEEYRVDEGSANSIINYIEEQKAVIPTVPTDKVFLIEGYKDLRGNSNIIFHFCLGRRVNDALSRAYAFAISNKLKCNIKVSVTDDNFMLTSPKEMALEKIPELLRSNDLEETLRRAVRNTELFKQRFRHCATRSFMILRNYKGHEISIGRQQLRSSKVLDYFHKLDNFPIIKEAYNEIQNDVMDLKNAKLILRLIEEGKIKICTSEYSELPSPLAHNVVLQGISDMVLMEDRSALLRELHRQVLRRIMPDVSFLPRIEPSAIKKYFKKKFHKVRDKEDLKILLRIVGPINMLQRKGANVFQFSDLKQKELEGIVRDLTAEGEIQSIYTPTGILWTLKEDLGIYSSIYAQNLKLSEHEEELLEHVKGEPKNTKTLSKELKLDIRALLRALKRLERTYEVYRGLPSKEEVLWYYRKVQHENLRKAVRRAVLQRLEMGPLTIFEISYYLGQDNKRIEPILKALERADIVTKGNFLGEEHEQYMLRKDLVRLSTADKRKERKSSGMEVDEQRIASYVFEKQFNIPGIKQYFDTFMDAAMPFDVFNHVKNFEFKQWSELRKKAHILQGRFLNGRVRHVRKDYADLLASAYRTEGLNEIDERVLEEIANSRGMTLYGLLKRLNEDKERIRESVEHLDTNLYIIRKSHEASGTQNFYISFEPATDIENYVEEILLRYLKGYGPAAIAAFQNYSSFSYEEIETALNKLESEGKIAKLRTESNEVFYLLKDELAPLRKARISEDMPLKILSIFDPYVQPIRGQVSSMYGDRWVFPIAKGGELIGTIEKWEMSGCIEVREIEIDKEFLDEVLKELDRVMVYYNQKGYEIIRIVRALDRNVDELDEEILKTFKRNGYFKIQKYLVKGNLRPECFEKEQILSYIFWKQGLHLDKYDDVIELVKAQGGIRTSIAASLRLPKPRGLERLLKKGILVKAHGIPNYLNYATPNLALIYKKSKSFKLREYDKLVLRAVEEEGPISRSELIKLSPLGYRNTVERLKKLYDCGYLVKDNNNDFLSVGNINISRAEARKKVIINLFQNFGIFSAENLAMYTKFEFKMRELRALLKELEDEGYLAKGYFINGDDTLYWIVKDDIPIIGNLKFKRKFVLPPQDNLWLYLQSEIRDQWGLGSCFVVLDNARMIAAFKGKARREELRITNFKGERSAWNIINEFVARNNLVMKEEFEKTEDWEIMMLYEKTKGKVIEK